MPYASVGALPDAVKKLEDSKQRQWMHVFNSMWKRLSKQGLSTEELEKRCASAAWASVKGKLADEFESLKKDLVRRLGLTRGVQRFESWLKEQNVDPTIPLFAQRNYKMVLPYMGFPEERGEDYDALVSHFKVIDWDNHVVAGYASTIIEDCDFERKTAEAIRKAGEAYMANGMVTYDFHGLSMKGLASAGIILNEYKAPSGKTYTTHFDEIGWFLVSQPAPDIWALIEQGKRNAYSIGFVDWHYSPVDAELITSMKITDVSYVPFGCDELCHFGVAKVDSRSLTDNITPVNHVRDGKDVITMSENTEQKQEQALTTLKAELLKTYPDAKDKIDALDCMDKAQALKKALDDAKAKAEAEAKLSPAQLRAKRVKEAIEEAATAKFEEMMADIDKSTQEAKEAKKKLESEDKFAKVLAGIDDLNNKLVEIKAKVDSHDKDLVKIKTEPIVKGDSSLEGNDEGISTPTLLGMSTPLRKLHTLEDKLPKVEES